MEPAVELEPGQGLLHRPAAQHGHQPQYEAPNERYQLAVVGQQPGRPSCFDHIDQVVRIGPEQRAEHVGIEGRTDRHRLQEAVHGGIEGLDLWPEPLGGIGRQIDPVRTSKTARVRRVEPAGVHHRLDDEIGQCGQPTGLLEHEFDQLVRRRGTQPSCDARFHRAAGQVTHDHRCPPPGQAGDQFRQPAGPRPRPVGDDHPGVRRVGQRVQLVEDRRLEPVRPVDEHDHGRIERGELSTPGVESDDIDARTPVGILHRVENCGLAGTSRAHDRYGERRRRICHDLSEQGSGARAGLERKLAPALGDALRTNHVAPSCQCVPIVSSVRSPNWS
jgi:hypothetical protein